MRLPLLALLVLALAVAGCASTPPPDTTGGTGGSGGTGGNNTTAPPPAPAPVAREVVNQTYSYSPQPPPEATFEVPAGFATIAFTATFTSTAPVCLIPAVTMTVANPDGETADFGATGQVGPACSVVATGQLPGTAGSWTVTFDGVGTAQVQLVGLGS